MGDYNQFQTPPMNTKLLLVCVGAVVTGAAASFAQTPTPPPTVAPAPPPPPPSPSFTVTATASAVSQYMFRGLRLSDGGFQPAVEMSTGNLTLGAWGNFPIDGDKVPDSSDPEIDLYGSYSIPLSEQITLA